MLYLSPIEFISVQGNQAYREIMLETTINNKHDDPLLITLTGNRLKPVIQFDQAAAKQSDLRVRCNY